MEKITPDILRLLKSQNLDDNYLGLNLLYGKCGSVKKVFETICTDCNFNITMKYYSYGYGAHPLSNSGYTMKAQYQDAFKSLK